jgi:hypothetical protein
MFIPFPAGGATGIIGRTTAQKLSAALGQQVRWTTSLALAAPSAPMALSRLAKEELPAYEADDGPLSTSDIKALGKAAGAVLSKGKVLKKQSLF